MRQLLHDFLMLRHGLADAVIAGRFVQFRLVQHLDPFLGDKFVACHSFDQSGVRQQTWLYRELIL